MTLYAGALRGERKRLGVMAAENGEGDFPFTDGEFYRSLCLAGHEVGLGVFIFSPCRIDWDYGKVPGYTYDGLLGKWTVADYPLPAVVYDRSFPKTRKDIAIYRKLRAKLAQTPGTRLLGNGLRNKWDVHRMLSRDPSLRVHLPKTRLLQSSSVLYRWLQDNGEAILKPLDGTHGRGVLHVVRTQGAAAHDEAEKTTYHLHGRDLNNEPISLPFGSFDALQHWLRTFAEERHFLIQRKLALATESGVPFDVRALMQKGTTGMWQLTGFAVRCGHPGGLTANLHGGGEAVEPESFLRERYGSAAAGELLDRLTQLSKRIPAVLESFCGRLAELGIDFGIDADGAIWIIEVNSKPGRSVFAQMQQPLRRKLSIESPVHYAKYMIGQISACPSQIV